jgi:hypothetical protein
MGGGAGISDGIPSAENNTELSFTCRRARGVVVPIPTLPVCATALQEIKSKAKILHAFFINDYLVKYFTSIIYRKP